MNQEEEQPTRFHRDTKIRIYLTSRDTYEVEQLCIVNDELAVYDGRCVPVACTVEQLGNAVLEAVTTLPRLSSAKRERRWSAYVMANHGKLEYEGRLFWDRVRDPEVLQFAALDQGRRMEWRSNVPVDAKPAAIGRMVRDGFKRARGGTTRGITDRKLLERLDRLDYFEVARNATRARKQLMREGWIAALSAQAGRLFSADAEDLAEGGVAALLASMKPFFTAIGLRLEKVRDDLRDTSYDVHIGKKSFPILMREDFVREREHPGYLWGIAAYRTSLLLNRLLRERGREEVAFSVESGNEHSFVCITPAMHAVLLKARGYAKARGPYRSNSRYPAFGNPAG